MDTLRERIPFRFSDNDEPEERQVLDEQEQEEIINNIRKENFAVSEHHNKFLQGFLGFTILFQFWFLLLSSRGDMTPMHVFFPTSKTPRPSLIPFTTLLTWLDIMLLLNVVLYLPKDMSFPRLIHSILSKFIPRLPLHIQETIRPRIPLPLGWTAAGLCLPPLLSVLTLRDAPQILWWFLPLFVVGIVVMVMSWIKETDIEVERLENLKYEAKGA